MAVTVESLSEFVKDVFGDKPYDDGDQERVVFGIDDNGHYGTVSIRICPLEEEAAAGICRLSIMFRFVTEDGNELNFSHLPYIDVLRFVNELHLSVDWSEVLVFKASDTELGIKTHHSLRQSSTELEEALEYQGMSNLHWTLHYMMEEFGRLAPLVFSYASGNTIEPEHVRMLVGEKPLHQAG